MISDQGRSEKATPAKQVHLEGLVSMRCQMLSNYLSKGWASSLTFRDAFCGDGENVVGGKAINGSPISIIHGLVSAHRKCIALRPVDHLIKCKFSDVRADAIAALIPKLSHKFTIESNLFTFNIWESKAEAESKCATEAISEDIRYLEANRKARLFLVIDTNGPSDIPFLLLQKILNDSSMRRRVDVVIHFSATAFKRVLNFKPAQKNMEEWFGRVETLFVETLSADETAWIRRPLLGDAQQWTLMVYWAKPYPDSDWNKQGFVKLGSSEGHDIIRHYTLTAKERDDA